MRFFQITLPSLMVAAILTGCSSDSITVHNSLNAKQVSVYLSEAAKHGALRTEITGNPFELSDDQFAERLTMALHGAHSGPEINFSTDAETNRNTRARLVVQFQPPATTNYQALCDLDHPLDASVPGEPSTLSARAALCVQGNAIDWAYISGPMPSSIEDEKFDTFASALAQGVIRPNLRSSDGCNNSNCN